MLIEWDLLLDLLEHSLKKNGNKEITIQHLINLMKMVNDKVGELEAQKDFILGDLD